MKFFQKTWVAVVITLAMVAGAVFIGLNRTDTVPNTPASVGLDTSLSTSRSEGFLLDEADVLSQEEEHQINLYNANWLERYDSLIAVAVVPSASGSLEDYAYERAMAWELAAADAVLVIETSSGSAYFLPGDNYPLTDSQINSYMNTYLYDGVANKEYASGILELFQEVNQYYVDQYGRGYLDNGSYGYGYQSGSTLYGIIMLVVILLVIATVVDNLRYASYRQRYYGVVNPPVVTTQAADLRVQARPGSGDDGKTTATNPKKGEGGNCRLALRVDNALFQAMLLRMMDFYAAG